MKRLVVVSPHLDDAILSIGGLLWLWAKGGHRVIVATVFTADEPAETPSAVAEHLHRLWGGTDVMARRRAEDHQAAERLGIEVVHLDLEDALHRLDAQGRARYTSLGSLFRRPQAEDESQPTAVAAALGSLPTADVWLVPLGLGDHVDHLHSRHGAELAQPATTRLAYYEEFPYAEKWFSGWTKRRGLSRLSIPLAPTALDARVEAIAAYESQIGPLFGDRRQLDQRVRSYCRKVGGERLWLPPATSPEEVLP